MMTMEDKEQYKEENASNANEKMQDNTDTPGSAAMNAENTTGEDAMGSGSEATNSGDNITWDREFEDED
jgi:hypothetical protein